MKGGKSKAASSKAESRLAVKKQTKKEKQVMKKPTKREKKAAKDPNMPKRPPSAFFVFMESFRKEFKEKNPDNKAVSAVGKAAGAEWKSMSDEDKAPYVAKAGKRKKEFDREMEAYKKKLAAGGDDKDEEDEEESDKSKSEVNDEDDEDGSGEEEEDDD